MSKVNRRPKWVSLRQLELLGTFLHSNKDIVSAFNKKKQEKEYTHRKWIEIAAKLNAVDDGVQRDWKGWSKYWVDFKAKLKRKVVAIRASQTETGGEPSTEHVLSEIETKFLSLLGDNFGQNLPVVRVEPFAQDSNNVPKSEGSEEDPNSGQPERIELEWSEDSQLYEKAEQSDAEDLGQFEDFGQSNADFGQSNADFVQSNADSAQSNIEDSGQSNVEETRKESSLKKAQHYRKRRRNTSDPTDRMIDYLTNRRKYKKTASLSNDDKIDVKCDRLDLLFLGYAETVRKLSKRKQVKVKFDIARILMESEICDVD